jgi:hypothetical protein
MLIANEAGDHAPSAGRRTSPACASAPERQVGRVALPSSALLRPSGSALRAYVKPPHKYNGQFLRSGVRRASYDTPGTPTRPLEAQDLTL